jgi:hypothetical protein
VRKILLKRRSGGSDAAALSFYFTKMVIHNSFQLPALPDKAPEAPIWQALPIAVFSFVR